MEGQRHERKEEERPAPNPIQSDPPSRTNSRQSYRSNRSSRHNSRNQIPMASSTGVTTKQGSPGFNNPFNRSSDSLDSTILLDHRSQAQSLPRASFLRTKPQRKNKGRGYTRHSESYTKKRPDRKQSQLAQAPDSSDETPSDDSSDDDDERTALVPNKKGRRQSSGHSGGNVNRNRHGSNALQYGTNRTILDLDENAILSPPRGNPNYPPSIPSSFGSRRNSSQGPARRPSNVHERGVRASISGRDESGDALRINVAKRVMQYANNSDKAVTDDDDGHEENQSASLADLPGVVSSSPPKHARQLHDQFNSDLDDSVGGGTEDEDRMRGRLASRAEEDVCFPLSDDEQHKDGHIDFDELEEWAREQIQQKEDGNESPEWRHRKLSEPMLVNGKYRNRGGWTTLDHAEDDDRPFRFTYFSDENASTVHSPTLYEVPQQGESFKDLFTTSNTWWLDVNSPTDAEMKILSSAFGIHPLTTEDISMEEQREKVELFRNYYLVSFRSFQQDPDSEDYLEPVNLYIVVFKDGVISFHFNTTPHPANVRRRIRQLRDYITVSSDWISYALIDDVVDAFSPLIHRIEFEVDTIDENVLGIDQDERESDDAQADMLRRIGACRKKVMGLLRLLGSKADVVKGFAKRCNEQWDVAPRSEIGLYLGDIQDHIVTMVQNLNHYEKILSRSHSNYLAQISIEMTKVNNDTNDVLSRLTVLGTMLIPMNLVTGLWG